MLSAGCLWSFCRAVLGRWSRNNPRWGLLCWRSIRIGWCRSILTSSLFAFLCFWLILLFVLFGRGWRWRRRRCKLHRWSWYRCRHRLTWLLWGRWHRPLPYLFWNCSRLIFCGCLCGIEVPAAGFIYVFWRLKLCFMEISLRTLWPYHGEKHQVFWWWNRYRWRRLPEGYLKS